VYYQAVDSGLCDTRAVESLSSAGLLGESELGLLKCVGVYPDAEIISVNHYRIGDRVVATGRYARSIRGPDGALRAEVWEDIASSLAKKPDATVGVSQTTLTERQSNYKGIPLSNGWTIPFHLSEDHQTPIVYDFRNR
jgi:hypothetical protein